MRNLIKSIPCLAALTLGVSAFAQNTVTPGPYSVYAGGTTNGGTTTSWAVVSAFSSNNGTPLVTLLNATSDLSSSKVQFFRVDYATAANLTNSTTSIFVANTNGFGTSDKVLIRHLNGDIYERGTTTTGPTSTNLVLTGTPGTTVVPGDLIYHLTSTGVGAIPCGAATLSLQGPGIYAGQQGLPLYMEIGGTSAATLNAVCASYVR